MSREVGATSPLAMMDGVEAFLPPAPRGTSPAARVQATHLSWKNFPPPPYFLNLLYLSGLG